MHDVLQRYVGQWIALNWDKPQQFGAVLLLDVTPGRITVSLGTKETVFHYAMLYVFSVAEGQFQVGRLGAKVTVPLLVQVAAWKP
jgi:hypothetical protein